MKREERFILMTLQEFELWLSPILPVRIITHIQQHHTYIPSYTYFSGSNHLDLQNSIRDYHVRHKGFRGIGQHFTTFPDGLIMTGRSMERDPACINRQNQGGICLEHLGNFDLGNDEMRIDQQETIVGMTAGLCRHFSLPLNTDSIVYHHWFDLDTGERNNGRENNKTCPGTNFFGGNSPEDCVTKFLPLIASALLSRQIII